MGQFLTSWPCDQIVLKQKKKQKKHVTSTIKNIAFAMGFYDSVKTTTKTQTQIEDTWKCLIASNWFRFWTGSVQVNETSIL